MKLKFKLFASLTDYLPADRKGNIVDLDLPAGTTIQTVIDQYRVPEKSAHLVLVNGRFIPPAARASHVLEENDELAIWPPVAGG
ncbi:MULTISPECIES: MoaD/ThiS family protein [Denitromonas]|uniref:MoaD/ThiS family protein n=2 Tax=Denitromonas TaxID=139331 RepID=A0A557SG08_9RHOO|nr:MULTISPECIES: MoaD/ThiS family protein [Denitromonas]TVO59495.1 MoaD/ThiS family protein [Denitromonas halophila]TVO59533.1 MoaD/ThiS family protein [Denitromonas ohlonensis]TVO76357.1 MoaD/ThiS family protein [Denitromonas ohlonensis]TVT48037.1 MAG: MoaD/ThiS family protein [Denitromonas halophila]TVT66604.1 MAG: MoaD/ThiS family protein [Denitromonas halophila]